MDNPWIPTKKTSQFRTLAERLANRLQPRANTVDALPAHTRRPPAANWGRLCSLGRELVSSSRNESSSRPFTMGREILRPVCGDFCHGHGF